MELCKFKFESSRGCRGCPANKLGDIWWKGPDWLQNIEKWPTQIEIKANEESEKEAKLIKEVMYTVIDDKTIFDNLLDKHDYWRFIRITTWVKRFITKCKGKTKLSGPLAIEETNKSIKIIIKRIQKQCSTREKFLTETLNLQENTDGILECRGRMIGDYPIHLPRSSSLSEKIVQEAHKKTLHGGPKLTIAEVRTKY